VVAEGFKIGHVVAVDTPGKRRVVDSGERHWPGRIVDLAGDIDHLRGGAEPAQDGVKVLAEALEPADNVVVDDVGDEQVDLPAPVTVAWQSASAITPAIPVCPQMTGAPRRY